jgi:hypothetical protein
MNQHTAGIVYDKPELLGRLGDAITADASLEGPVLLSLYHQQARIRQRVIGEVDRHIVKCARHDPLQFSSTLYRGLHDDGGHIGRWIRLRLTSAQHN